MEESFLWEYNISLTNRTSNLAASNLIFTFYYGSTATVIPAPLTDPNDNSR